MPKEKFRLDYEGTAWDLVSLVSSDKSYQSAFKSLGSNKKITAAEMSLQEKFKKLADGCQLPPPMWHEAHTEKGVAIWRMRAGKIRAYAWKSVKLAKTIIICHYAYKKTQSTADTDIDKIVAKYKDFER